MPDEATSYYLGGGKQAQEAGEFLTDAETARLLRVSRRTLLRWRRDGGGPAYIRAGARRVLYGRVVVDNWAAARTFAHLAAESVAKAA